MYHFPREYLKLFGVHADCLVLSIFFWFPWLKVLYSMEKKKNKKKREKKCTKITFGILNATKGTYRDFYCTVK